ncbi:MAG TPA: PhzF family phenazine biosynthesis protein [Vicinamibacteria bacterium]|nr:PhzF family phenazine biosynthesis protein [Vicinamibacteria bacterium]
MKLRMFQVDAFATDGVFTGNPAAVLPLTAWLDDDTMQRIAAENNLAETAFVVPEGADHAIRWMTPRVEVDLCGHATLAAGFVILDVLRPGAPEVRFGSRSGPLRVFRDGDRLSLDFPVTPLERGEVVPAFAEALGVRPLEVWSSSRDSFAVLPSVEDVAGLRPSMTKLEELGRPVCVTAAGGPQGADFVSRFFAPTFGIPEDPATGSTHTSLVPYWEERLGRARLHARQLSPRGAELLCERRGDRVMIAGRAALYLDGTIEVPERR